VAREWAQLAEAAAEGKASRQNLEDAFAGLDEALDELLPSGEFEALERLAECMWPSEWPYKDWWVSQTPTWLVERKAQACLVRDVFGNLFRDVAVDPAWLGWKDGTVIKLAQGIYDDRAFDRLPVLADALEEAGCDNAYILAHCRQPGEHVRGCWAVDLLLGQA
jgi:hypothetical protein